MSHFIKKALTDIRLNRFLNLVTIFTISLSILVASVFLLFFENAGRVIEAWNQGGRVMIYLKDNFTMDMMPELKDRINGLGNIREIILRPYRIIYQIQENMVKQLCMRQSLSRWF